MPHSLPSALDILDFWWSAGPSKWFAKNDKFDKECQTRFAERVEQAFKGELDDWANEPTSMFALILLLDQFPRNIFRGSPRAFEGDPKAQKLAELAIQKGFDRAFPKDVRSFFYLPFEHAEDMALQEKCVDLARRLGHQEFYLYALIHMDAIRRFGRFPHRNKVLGRTSTPEEEAYLADGGFSA